MNELFKEEIIKSEDKLQKKGYYVANMPEPYNDEFEVYDRDCKVVIDHLSVAQLTQLAEMMEKIA